MLNIRFLAAGLASLAAASLALADFDGPAPLAWRWIQPTNASVKGSPIIIGGSVYVAVGQRVFCLDRETGNQKWRYPLVDPIDGNFLGAPIQVGDTLVATADNRKVYGLDPATGQERWVYRTNDSISGTPVAVGKYFAVAQRDGSILAMDPTTGEPIWTDPSTHQALPVRMLNGIQGQITGTQDSVLVMDNVNELVSINLVTKKPNWTAKFSILDARAQPVVVGDTTYVNSGQYLTAIRTATGRAQWQVGVGSNMPVGPSVSGGGILVVTEDGQGLVFDPGGHRLNKKPYDWGTLPMVQPAVAGKLFVMPTTGGAVNLIDPASGQVLWSYLIRPIGILTVQQSGSGRQNNPGPGNNRGNTQTTSQPDRIWTVQAAGTPVVSGDTLLVLARDGSLLAFDKNTGVDLTAPRVTMTWPGAGEMVNGESLDVLFKVEDEASGVDVKSLKITVDGNPVDTTFDQSGVADVRFSIASKNVPLTNGRKVFTVSVSDWLGNDAKQDFVLTIDNNLPKSVRPPSDNQKTGGGPGKGGGGGGPGGGAMGGG